MRIYFYVTNALDSETVLTQLMQEGFEQIPSDNRMEIYLGALMFKDTLIIFPRLLNTKDKLFLMIRILKPIKTCPINELTIKGLNTKIKLNLKHFLNFIRFRKNISKLTFLIDFIKIIMIKTINIERLSLGCMLIFYCLLKFC